MIWGSNGGAVKRFFSSPKRLERTQPRIKFVTGLVPGGKADRACVDYSPPFAVDRDSFTFLPFIGLPYIRHKEKIISPASTIKKQEYKRKMRLKKWAFK
jgi:hypothetical protein